MVLIARLIAEPDTLSANLERAKAEMEDQGLRLASAAMLDFCGDVLQLGLPEGDRAALRTIVDRHFAPSHTPNSRCSTPCISASDGRALSTRKSR